MSTLSRICSRSRALPGGRRRCLRAHEPRAGRHDAVAVAAATFCFLGVVSRRGEDGPRGTRPAGRGRVHVAPTIWPFGFAIAGVILALGLIVSSWILILGGLVVRRSRPRVGSATSPARTHAEAP